MGAGVTGPASLLMEEDGWEGGGRHDKQRCGDSSEHGREQMAGVCRGSSSKHFSSAGGSSIHAKDLFLILFS